MTNGFNYRHGVICEDGTLVMKYMGDIRLLVVVINIVHVVGKRDGVRWYWNSGNREF